MRITIGIVASILLSVGSVQAQPRPLWGRLEPGPHPVGFRVIHTVDTTRSHTASETGQARSRPIQLSIWYPAAPDDEAIPMPFHRYVLLEATQEGARVLSEEESREAADAYRSWITGRQPNVVPDEAMHALLRTPTAVYEDASPRAGPFPAVYLVGAARIDPILAEYLASHGYVVAGTPVFRPPDYDAQVSDIGFALDYLSTQPYADTTKQGLIGFGGGGLWPYLLAMQRPGISALVTVESALFIEPWLGEMRRLPYYDLQRMQAPLLHIIRRNLSEEQEDLAAYDSLAHIDRLRVLLDDERLDHPDLMSVNFVRLHLGLGGALHEVKQRTNEAILYTIRLFLASYLKDDPEAQRLLTDDDLSNHLPASFTPVYHPAHD